MFLNLDSPFIKLFHEDIAYHYGPPGTDFKSVPGERKYTVAL